MQHQGRAQEQMVVVSHHSDLLVRACVSTIFFNNFLLLKYETCLMLYFLTHVRSMYTCRCRANEYCVLGAVLIYISKNKTIFLHIPLLANSIASEKNYARLQVCCLYTPHEYVYKSCGFGF